MNALETAFLNKLKDPDRNPNAYRKGQGLQVKSTALPTDGHWHPDPELKADARWWAEQPLKVVEA